MNTADLFRRIIGALERAGIPHMLTGSFASAYHGSPRATQDIDLVIETDAPRLRALIQSLPTTEYYVDEEAALGALRDESQFNVIDLATGWKVDLIIRKSRPFSRQEFERRALTDFEGGTLAVATAEDLIVAKLEWARAGGSSRQIEDVASMLRIRRDDLDLAHVERWVHDLGLGAEWQAVRGLGEE